MQRVNDMGSWFKNHILVSVLLGVLVIGGLVILGLTLSKVFNKTRIELKEKLDIEMNSDVYLVSLINTISNGELLTDNYKIDTSKLGKQEISIKYLNQWKNKKEYKFSINIVDTAKPTIEFKKDLSTTVGTKIDLLKEVKVKDNSNEEIKATVEGKYDFNKAGTYKLKYVAVDSSNNKTEEEFTLKVEDITTKFIGKYIAKGEDSISKMSYVKLKKSNEAELKINFCEGFVECKGTYNIKYDKKTNNYTLNITSLKPWNGTYLSSLNNSSFKFNIKNNTLVVVKGFLNDSFDCSYATKLVKE